MPLRATTHPAKSDEVGVFFWMDDCERLVRVDVPRAQLMALGSSAIYSAARDLGTFEHHRDDAERIASAKYDDDGYHDYANSRVVVLSPADWRRAPEQQRRHARPIEQQAAAR
jgi:nitric oxide reductase activation protein